MDDERITFYMDEHVPRAVTDGLRRRGVDVLMDREPLPSWLPVTKFSPPAPRPDLIVRSRLMDRLRVDIERHRLVLISAPAGSGKTTLLEAGLRGPASRSSWVAVDEEDNDPARFVALLIIALGRIEPHIGAGAKQLLGTLSNPAAQARQLITALINDLATISEPIVLVLDDLHRITEPTTYEALDYLLERLPPQIHLVIATRHDPPLSLPRLRARGELTEIRLPDLRFTREETALFFKERHDLDLSDEALSLLDQRVEGWAVGIRLLAAALAQVPARQDQDAIMANLSGVDRQMFDFLMQEVFRHESGEMQTFLLETSILNRLTPSLCRAVTGRDDAAARLDELEHRNLFVTRLAERGEPTFRYHDLFAEFLRQYLEREAADLIVELHRRAAQAHPNPTDAVGHLLAAGLWEDAAQRIEAVGESLLHQGLAATLNRWLTMLPSDVIDVHPRLLYLRGLVLWYRGETIQARSILERAVPDLAAVDAHLEEGESTAALATIALMQGDDDRARTLIEQALSLPVRPPTQVQLLLERGRARLWRGERAAAVADLDTALEISRQSADRETVAALLTYLHPIFSEVEGGLDRAERACRLADSILRSGEGPAQVTLDEQWTLVHLRRGKFDSCLASGRRALVSCERYGSLNPLMDLWTIWSLAIVHAARRQYREADQYCEMLLGLARPGEPQRAPVLYTWAWVCWLQGRSREAREAYQELCSLEPLLPVTPILQTTLHGLLLLGEGDYTVAERVLRQAVAQARGLAVSGDLHGNPALHLAHLHLVVGRPGRAVNVVAAALEAAERDDAPGLIAKEGPPMIPLMRLARERGVKPDVASHVLEVLGVPQERKPVRIPGTGELLSPREAELLHLLAAGKTNREIAQRLVIGDQTVKTHVSHILRKLDASSRTEAAARARELGLI